MEEDGNTEKEYSVTASVIVGEPSVGVLDVSLEIPVLYQPESSWITLNPPGNGEVPFVSYNLLPVCERAERRRCASSDTAHVEGELLGGGIVLEDAAMEFHYYTFSFKSVVTRHAPPCRSQNSVEVTRHSGLCRTSKRSRRSPNCPKSAKKTKISVQMPKFSRCHAKIRALPKCRIDKMGHASHPLSI
jgi:hypothetical protein